MRLLATSEQHPWGRVDETGTVYVREGDGERAVGEYPDGTPEEAIAYFERKYTDLAGQVGLLEQRARRGAPAADVAKSVASLRTAVEGANAVGDLPSLLTRLDALGDTVEELTEQQSAEAKAALTFEAVTERYLEHVAAKKKPATHSLYKHLLNAYALPTLAKRPATSLTSLDIAPLHLKMSDKATTANRFLAVVSSMYEWAVDAKLLAKMENPAAGIEKYTEKARDRYLTSEELQRLGDAIDEAETDGIPWEPDPAKKTKHAPKPENRRLKIDPAVAAALRLYILTGARRGEILSLTWEMVDLERGLLFLPDSKTGQKTIILNAPAQLILSELPRIDKFVIPGRAKVGKNGKIESRARHDIKRPWTLIRKRAGLLSETDDPRYRVRLHDLRHTHASIGVGSNLGLPIVGKLLGHKQARTTERYAHLDIDPVRKASDAIGSRIMDAMGGRKTERDNVVPMRPGKSK